MNISDLSKKTGISEKDLEIKLNEKMNKFSDLITKDGAIYILAKELGVEMNNVKKPAKLKDLDPSLKSIDIMGRVIKISPVREFIRSDGKKGKVVNLHLSDGTGYVRMPLWDDQTNLVEEGTVGLGSILNIRNAMVKENTFGEMELSLRKFSSIQMVENSNFDLPSYEEMTSKYFSNSSQRVQVKDIAPGNWEVVGTIVQIFKSKFVFENTSGESYMIISCVIEDGTGDLRAVFFRELAEQLSGLKPDDIKNLDEEARYKLISKNLAGKEIVIQGRVSKNQRMGKFEMIASGLKSLNVLEESNRLVDSVESSFGV